MLRLSRAEAALFLIPLLLVPAAILGRRWKVATTPKPTPLPTPVPTPIPNLYSNGYGLSGVEAILPSRDGRWIYTGEPSNKTRFGVWNAQSGALIRHFGKFNIGSADAVLAPNGKVLGFGNGGWNGNRVVLFNAVTGKEKLQIAKPRARGYGFDVNDRFVALPTDDDVRFFSVDSGKLGFKLRHKTRDSYPKSPRFSPDGRQVLWLGSSNRDFASYANGNNADELVWFDVQTKKRLGAVEFSQTELRNAQFSGDGKIILDRGLRRYWVKGRNGHNAFAIQTKLFALEAKTGEKLYSLTVNDYGSDIAVSPDGKWFTWEDKEAVGKGVVKTFLSLREVQTGNVKHRVENESLGESAWSPDSRTLYIGYRNLWRLRLQPDATWELDKGKMNR